MLNTVAGSDCAGRLAGCACVRVLVVVCVCVFSGWLGFLGCMSLTNFIRACVFMSEWERGEIWVFAVELADGLVGWVGDF